MSNSNSNDEITFLGTGRLNTSGGGATATLPSDIADKFTPDNADTPVDIVWGELNGEVVLLSPDGLTMEHHGPEVDP